MDEHEASGAGARQRALRDPRDERGRDRGVDGVAAGAQDLRTRRSRQRVASGDRPSHGRTVPGKQERPLNVGRHMRPDYDLSSFVSRRGLAAAGLFLGAIGVLVTPPGLLGHQVRNAALSIEDARPIWLWAAAFCFLAALVATASAWR